MTPSFLPRALLFKEWKEHRWWLVAGFILLVYSPLSNFFGIFLSVQTGGDNTGRIIWGALIPILYHVQYSPGNTGAYPTFNFDWFHGRPAVSMFSVVFSMGLMIVLLTAERQRNTLWCTFSFPIRRADILRVKIMLAVTVVLSGFLLDFLMLAVCDLAVHQAVPFAFLWEWFGENLLISVTLMGIGLACAASVQSGFIAGILALLAASVPWGLGISVFRSLPREVGLNIGLSSQSLNHQVSSSIHSGSVAFSGHLSMFLRSLSPTSFFSGTSGFSGPFSGKELAVSVNWGHPLTLGLILWFACVALGGGIVGGYAYLHAPVENTSRWVLFPGLEIWLLWLFCGALTLLFVNAITANTAAVNHTPYLLTGYWFAAWLAIGLPATGIRRAIQRRTQLS